MPTPGLTARGISTSTTTSAPQLIAALPKHRRPAPTSTQQLVSHLRQRAKAAAYPHVELPAAPKATHHPAQLLTQQLEWSEPHFTSNTAANESIKPSEPLRRSRTEEGSLPTESSHWQRIASQSSLRAYSTTLSLMERHASKHSVLPPHQPAPQPAPNIDRDRYLRAYSHASALVKSGLLHRPTLISRKPAWWTPPPAVEVAAHTFDTWHRIHSARADRALHALRDEEDNEKKQMCFSRSVVGLKGNRFFVPELADDVPVPVKVRHEDNERKVIGEVWSLESSIWGPRKARSDSKDFQDTEAVIRESLELDWQLCLDANHTSGWMLKLDKETPELLKTCFDALWDCATFIYGTYDYYATLGNADGVTHVRTYGYKKLINDCDLIVPGSKICNTNGFDQLFVLINAKSDDKFGINRQEWLQMLVRIAAMRYVYSGAMKSLPAALTEFIFVDLMPKVDRRALQDTWTFREELCYSQDTDEMLREYEGPLRALFKVYGRDDSGMLDGELNSNALIDYSEWRVLLRDLQLYDEDFKDREASLTFSWCRMRVIDERPLKAVAKVSQLTFEDFLEAFVRVATLKVLPTQEQLYDAGADGVCNFFRTMRSEQPAKHTAFVCTHMREWDAPLPEPIHRLVESLSNLIIDTVKEATGESKVDIKAVAKFKVQCDHDYTK